MVRQAGQSSRSQKGFTLVEVMMVVAIVGLLASIAIPSVQNAMYKARKNATGQEMKVMRDALIRFAADNGRYPFGWTEFNNGTLAPVVPNWLPKAEMVTKHLAGKRIDWYIPWNYIDEWWSDDLWDSPQSFLYYATPEWDRKFHFIVTDQNVYYYVEGDWYLKEFGTN